MKIIGSSETASRFGEVSRYTGLYRMNTIHYWYGKKYGEIHEACRNVVAQKEGTCFILAEEFIGSLLDSVRNSDLSGFRKKFQNPEVLIIDGADYVFSGKEATQEELLFLLRKRSDMRKTTYMTGYGAPSVHDFIEPLLMLIEDGQIRQFE